MSSTTIILLILLVAGMFATASVVFFIFKAANIPNLKTRRLYLDPSLSLAARKRILAQQKAGDSDTDFYSYYVVLPGEEFPVFHCSDEQLAEAEFLIIEYFVPQRIKAEAS